MDFKDFLKLLTKHNKDEFVVGKTVPLKKEWAKEYAEMCDMGDQADLLRKKHDSMRSLFWSKVELELNEYGQMRVNRENNEIEIEVDEKSKKKPIKSPFVN